MHKAELYALSGLELVFELADGFLFSCILFGFFSSLKSASLRCMSFVNTSKDVIVSQRWTVEQTTLVSDKQINR